MTCEYIHQLTSNSELFLCTDKEGNKPNCEYRHTRIVSGYFIQYCKQPASVKKAEEAFRAESSGLIKRLNQDHPQ
jgi:hypothetical protein